MNWRQIERWATIAIYISAGVGLAMLMVEELSPPGSPAAQLGETVGRYLTRLGEIGGGALFAIVLAYLTIIGATWLMVLLMEGIDRLRSRRARAQLRMQQMQEEFRAKIREEVREEFRANIREEMREEFRAEIHKEMREGIDDVVQERLAQLGIVTDTSPHRDTTAAAEPRPANGAPLAGHGSAGLTEENIRSVVRECLLQLASSPARGRQRRRTGNGGAALRRAGRRRATPGRAGRRPLSAPAGGRRHTPDPS